MSSGMVAPSSDSARVSLSGRQECKASNLEAPFRSLEWGDRPWSEPRKRFFEGALSVVWPGSYTPLASADWVVPPGSKFSWSYEFAKNGTGTHDLVWATHCHCRVIKKTPGNSVRLAQLRHGGGDFQPAAQPHGGAVPL